MIEITGKFKLTLDESDIVSFSQEADCSSVREFKNLTFKELWLLAVDLDIATEIAKQLSVTEEKMSAPDWEAVEDALLLANENE